MGKLDGQDGLHMSGRLVLYTGSIYILIGLSQAEINQRRQVNWVKWLLWPSLMGRMDCI